MGTKRVSFAEVIVLICSGLIVASISMVKIQHHRAAARKSACSSNLFEIALGVHNYHSAYKQMPMGSGGTTAAPGSELWQSNHDRLSAFVPMLPFLGEQRLWETIYEPLKTEQLTFPSMGPAPWFDAKDYEPWSQRPNVLACSSDPDVEKFPTVSSYVMNYGDAVHMVGSPYDPKDEAIAAAIRASNRGIFYGKHVTKFRDCLDGLSNIVMFSEACVASKHVAKNVDGLSLDPSRCIAAHENPRYRVLGGRRACWADGSLRSCGFQTILPPNSPSATAKGHDLEGVLSASSHHVGGVHALMADGAVIFVSDTIDSGANNAPTVALLPDGKHAKPKSKSPYGLWGAMGTRACGERIDRTSFEPTMLELTDTELANVKRRPVQTWRNQNGTEIRGHLIATFEGRLIYWCVDGNEMKQVRLRDLTDADSLRAQELDSRLSSRIKLRLKVQANKAIGLLADKDYAGFCDQIVSSTTHDRKQLQSMVKENNKFLTKSLEHVIQELDNPRSRWVSRRMTKHGPVKIRLPEFKDSPVGKIEMDYTDERWTMQLK